MDNLIILSAFFPLIRGLDMSQWGNPSCWVEGRTFERCCLGGSGFSAGGDARCWGDETGRTSFQDCCRGPNTVNGLLAYDLPTRGDLDDIDFHKTREELHYPDCFSHNTGNYVHSIR
jgi:hypothetical protein